MTQVKQTRKKNVMSDAKIRASSGAVSIVIAKLDVHRLMIVRIMTIPVSSLNDSLINPPKRKGSCYAVFLPVACRTDPLNTQRLGIVGVVAVEKARFGRLPTTLTIRGLGEGAQP